VELILWRHAEAEVGEPDLARKLTARGEKQARRVAEWLHGNLPDSARIFSSPATRALQTAQALVELSGRKFRVVDGLAPGASVEDVLTAVDWPNAKVTIVAVGHQPTFGHVASRLVAGTDAGWSIRKGGLWWLSSREREGDEEVVVRAVTAPDLL
jgi:phosphohistidine phosphatase